MKTALTRITILGASLALAACASHAPVSSTAAEAIRAILEEDSALGSERNRASESKPLAEAVQDYVQGLDAIDFGDCPPDFTSAFKRHRDAWEESIQYFEQHSELGGELHDLFDEIRESGKDARHRIESIENDIWSTWAEVKAAVDRHGGGSD